LRDEDLEDVDHVVHGRPCLVDDVEAYRAGATCVSALSTDYRARRCVFFEQNVQFIDVGVEYPVHEADARTLVRVLVWQLDVDLPEAALEGRCWLSGKTYLQEHDVHTVFWSLEPDVELLPILRQFSAVVRSDDKRNEH
jgi:hypothetical protein